MVMSTLNRTTKWGNIENGPIYNFYGTDLQSCKKIYDILLFVTITASLVTINI